VTATQIEFTATDAGIPVASHVMGGHVNQRRAPITGGLCVTVIIALNVLLLWQQLCQS
jgi:Mn2+/Fe2+ NRAMP family transporter